MSASHEPWALLIQKAMPAIEESLRNVVGRQEAAFGKVISETTSIKAMLERVLQAQEEQAIQEFTVTTTVSPKSRAAVVVVLTSPPLSSLDSVALASTSALPPPQTAIPLGGAPTTPPTPVTLLVRKDVILAYKLNREIQTIPALWRLWTVGIGGAPSVEELDQQYGAGWRQTSSERQYYSMRKTLIDEIKRRTEKAGDRDFARVVSEMEASRISSRPPASIDKVIKALKAGSKAKRAAAL